ncbi:transposase IS891/IS1136/IS1341 family, partial [Caldalkalibacillus thermarum TA2.A1]
MPNKAYKFRLYPTQEQEQLLAKTFGCVRFVYNKMLEERIHIYEK